MTKQLRLKPQNFCWCWQVVIVHRYLYDINMINSTLKLLKTGGRYSDIFICSGLTICVMKNWENCVSKQRMSLLTNLIDNRAASSIDDLGLFIGVLFSKRFFVDLKHLPGMFFELSLLLWAFPAIIHIFIAREQ